MKIARKYDIWNVLNNIDDGEKKVGERGKCTRRKLNWTLLATSPVFFHVNVNGAPYSKGIKSFLKSHFAISKRETWLEHIYNSLYGNGGVPAMFTS